MNDQEKLAEIIRILLKMLDVLTMSDTSGLEHYHYTFSREDQTALSDLGTELKALIES